MSNTYTKLFQDGQAITESQLNSGFTTVKPSLANLALSTTGSSAFQVLRSAGSNTTPAYDDIGDVLASGTMTAAGANAVASAMNSTGANAIITSATLEADSSSNGLLPRYQKTTIDLSSNGDFTSGDLKIERIADLVTITAVSDILHTSGSVMNSDSATIPSWAIPAATKSTVFYLDGSILRYCQINTSGSLQIVNRDWAGNFANTNSSGALLNISYSIGSS